jgi:hypothetical protein
VKDGARHVQNMVHISVHIEEWSSNGRKPSVSQSWMLAGSIFSMAGACLTAARSGAPSPRGGEQRWISVGELDIETIAVVWTWRGAAIRIITMRKARDEEKRRYRALYG